VPRNQNEHVSIKSTIAAFWHCCQLRPFPTYIYGPYHEPIKIRQIWCNSYHCRLRLLQSSKIHPLLQNDQWTKCSPQIPKTPRALVQHFRKDHIWSKLLLHFTLLQNPLCWVRSLTKSVNGPPLQNRWPDWANECLGRTIPQSLDNGETEQLGKTIAHSRVHS